MLPKNMNLLIVDDESEILTGLEELFRYSFDIEADVYTATSAYKALELLDQIHFDVVLTDIKMPGMKGTALFQKIKSNWPKCKTVFLTGYRNFDDMYQIVNHKDVKYLLKSEDDAVILSTVKEAYEELQSEIAQEVLREKLQYDVKKYRLWEGQEFIESVLKGEMIGKDKDEAAKQAREIGIPIDMAGELLMFLARIDVKDGLVDQKDERYALLHKANQLIERNLPEDVRHYTCVVQRRWSLGIVQQSVEGQDISRLFAVVHGAIEYAQVFFEKLTGRSFSVAIESTAVGLKDIPPIYTRMTQIMAGGLGSDKNRIAHVETIQTLRKQNYRAKAMAKIPLMKTYLELNRRQDYFELMDEVGEELLKSAEQRDAYGKELYYSVSVLLLRFIHENQFSEQLAYLVGLNKLTNFDEHSSWQEAFAYLYDVSIETFALLESRGNHPSGRALKRICEYIEQNLGEDLSLTRLADVGGFNPSYLSRLFRQVYNQTITDYIYQKRMKYAEDLLKDTNLKIQEIAEKTGYLSSHSFARAFRNLHGASPAEYRETQMRRTTSNW